MTMRAVGGNWHGKCHYKGMNDGGSTTLEATEEAEGTKLQADVPFAFTVVNETLPAGRYTLRSMDDEHRLAILGSELAVAESSPVESSQTPKITKVVFRRYADHYFLHQVWVRGEKSGFEVPVSNIERQLAGHYKASSVAILATT